MKKYHWIVIAALPLFAIAVMLDGLRWTPTEQVGLAGREQLVAEAGADLSKNQSDASAPSRAAMIETSAPIPTVERTDTEHKNDPSRWRTLSAGQSLTVTLSNPDHGALTGMVTRVWDDDGERQLNATFNNPFDGLVAMRWRDDLFTGILRVPDLNLAYTMQSTADGELRVEERLFSELICAKPREGTRPPVAGTPVWAGMPRPTNDVPPALRSFPPPTTRSIPVLRSRPSSGNVIYLDFDGETVNDSFWSLSTIVAAPARLSDSQIQEVWRRVVTDFEMYDVNVTTVALDYTNATPGRRTHVIITPTDTAAPGAGGVAYIDSFGGLYSRYCWVFIDTEAKACAEVVSHEVGHTLGLFHDGRSSPPEEYYAGHGDGPTGWAPIMGVGYYQDLTQWSKGEYLNANNTEDDLLIMASYIPYLADDHGNATGTASAIVGASVEGRIERNTDMDVFSVSLTSGPQTIYLQPSGFGNLDGLLEVFNGSGSLIATSNPPDELSAAASFVLPTPQTVFLRVRGTGKPPVLGTGYSSYSSLGSYTLFGFGDQQQPPSAPIGLTIKRISGSQLQVSWQSALSATNYLVDRNAQPASTTTNTLVVDTDLLPGTLYSYAVRAENDYGLSPWSDPAAIATPLADEFIMDGEADFGDYLVSNPGMVIHAAVRGTRLYVSTWSPGSDGAGFGSDHHLFVSDVLLPSATTPAPWAKRGSIAIPGNKPFLAGESASTYAGWFNTSGPTTLFKPPVNSLQMEGSIDLVAEFGGMPDALYVAAVAYQTDDANGSDPNLGRINAQAPSAVFANDNLEPEEFLEIPLAAIRDTALDGVYDVLSPDHAFILNLVASGDPGHAILAWQTVPGASFNILRKTNLTDATWQTIGVRTTLPGQWNHTYAVTNPPAAQSFYSIQRP